MLKYSLSFFFCQTKLLGSDIYKIESSVFSQVTSKNTSESSARMDELPGQTLGKTH
jgi:hypothetical protein